MTKTPITAKNRNPRAFQRANAQKLTILTSTVPLHVGMPVMDVSTDSQLTIVKVPYQVPRARSRPPNDEKVKRHKSFSGRQKLRRVGPKDS